MTGSDLDVRLQRFRARRGHAGAPERGDDAPAALAEALLDAGRPQDALDVVHLGLLDGEPSVELLTLEGRALYEQGDLRESQAALLRAIKADPLYKEAYRRLGQVLIERGDPRRAVQVLERAARLDPADASLHKALQRAQRLSTPQPGAESQPRVSVRPGSSASQRASGPSSRPPKGGGRAKDRGAGSGRSGGDGQRSGRRGPVHDDSPRGDDRAGAARAYPDPLAQALLDERPGKPRPTPARSTGREQLPFDDEIEHDDAPTHALDLTNELRALRASERASERATRAEPAPHGYEGEEDPTSIIPSPRELEQISRSRSADAYDDGIGDATVIGSPALLAAPGQPESPEQVLGMLRAQGVFEPSASPSKPPPAWVPSVAVERSGSSILRSLAIGWGLMLLVGVGGYFGFQAWLSQHKEEAAQIVEKALADAYEGQHASLASAASRLNDARELDPRAPATLEALLFVQALRVLEEGDQELAPLRQTLERADQQRLPSRLRLLASAIAGPPAQQREGFDELRALIHRDAERDARLSYLAGRLAQRTGKFDVAQIFLTQATTLAPQLSRAWLARGELARMEGQLEQAKELFQRALGADGQLLRAELWLAILESQVGQPIQLLARLDALQARVEQGADPERLLAASARAGAQLALGKPEVARTALDAVAGLHVQDPELLGLYTERALESGQLLLAYRAARAANVASGGAPRYQALLATALLQQPDGGSSLANDAGLDEGQGMLAIARAEAALLTDVREALEHAKKDLGSYRATPEGRDDLEASALLMRIDLRLGANVESLLPAARALAQRAPNTAVAHVALAEALITAGQGQPGIAALAAVHKLAPGAADLYYLTGRAEQLLERPDDARKSLERALSIAPGHVEARLALGRSLLDVGEYESALSLLRGIENRAGGAPLLGVIEALLGTGRIEEAAHKLASLPEPLRPAPPVGLLRAKLALVRGKPADALAALAPLVADESEARSASALALYGDALLASDRVDGAVLAYDGALEMEANHPDALIGRARAALRADRPEQTLAWTARADAALAVRPRPPEVRALLLVTAARADLAKQQLAPARDRLTRATTLPGAPAEAWFWLGEVVSKSDAAAAAKHYAKYLELEPKGPYVARARAASGAR
ncbi:MAG: tetratricopeptide repeat protein [Polyangiales bacterium]